MPRRLDEPGRIPAVPTADFGKTPGSAAGAVKIPAPPSGAAIGRHRVPVSRAATFRAVCSVYVVELHPEVLTERKFLRENPRRDPSKPCLYVGSTCLPPDERFRNHMRGHKANPFVYRYGVRLRPEFYQHYPVFTRDEAELTERELALTLRDQGYGVWYNV